VEREKKRHAIILERRRRGIKTPPVAPLSYGCASAFFLFLQGAAVWLQNGNCILVGERLMKKALLSMLGVLAIGLLVAADDKKADDVKDKLKGTWDVVSMEVVGGPKLPDEAVKGQTLTFEGDKMTHEEKGKKEPATFKIVDATKKPLELDMTPTEGPDKGKAVKMILELKDDMLKIAGKRPGEDRPKGFDEKDTLVITLKRAKK
jgi:uncharacterized protein (TIGR03067 family)